VGWGEGLHGKIKPNKNNALTMGKVRSWGSKNKATSFLETIFGNSESQTYGTKMSKLSLTLFHGFVE
jgi:hypothetical protein